MTGYYPRQECPFYPTIICSWWENWSIQALSKSIKPKWNAISLVQFLKLALQFHYKYNATRTLGNIYIFLYMWFRMYVNKCIYTHHHHHVALLARIPLTLSSAVSRISCSSYLNGFSDRSLVVVQLLFRWMLLPGFVQYSS